MASREGWGEVQEVERVTPTGIQAIGAVEIAVAIVFALVVVVAACTVVLSGA